MRKAALALVLTGLLAGCGGPGNHTLAKTRSCLEGKGARIGRPKNDFVATTASGGAIRAFLKDNFVTLDFGADENEAQSLAAGYNRFHAKNVGVADILFTDRNVAMLWKIHPSTADAELVTGCLK